MNGYEITTAHNVTIRYEYASLGHRILAYILDALIQVGFFAAIIFVGFLIFKDSEDMVKSPIFWVLVGIFVALPYTFYHLLFEYFMGGQSPGKRIMKIKVASDTSEHLSFGQCLVRWLFRVVDFGFCYGVIAMITISSSQKKQRIGDLVAGTIVVSLKAEKTLDETIYAHVQNTREPRYLNAGRLTPREIEIIKEVIRQYDAEDKYDLLSVTAERVRKAVDASYEEHDIAFLRSVVDDYYILGSQA